MGKSLPRTSSTSDFHKGLTGLAPIPVKHLTDFPSKSVETSKITPSESKYRDGKRRRFVTSMEGGSVAVEKELRLPLSEVVAECLKRWFGDTLKEARAGDVSMQVLLGQMYYNGYGVSRDAHKGRLWMTRASRVRSSVWKVCNKHPGYNASDSDSDELAGES